MNTKRILSLFLALITVLGLAVSATSAAEDSPYTDVKPKRWSYADIMYATENGLMNGTSADKFAPAETMTRAMVVTVLHRLQGSPAVKYSAKFKDVKEKAWYAAAVIWAAENDIVNGVGEGKFAPMETITREQLATIIMRYAPAEYIITEERADITGYADYKRVHDYAREALSWANAIGLITGKTESTLAPREGATREQFAAILRRFKEYEGYKYELVYNEPKPISTYTEKEYPLVTDADIYVAVDGKDTNKGTIDAPIATLARAKEMVRELKATKTEGEIRVAFKAGTYKAPESLSFTAEDAGTEACPIVYCAYGDGAVVFNGGVTLPADEFTALSDSEKEMFPESTRDSVKKIDLSRYGLNAAELTEDNGLFLGNTRLDVARWPNKLDSGNDDFVGRFMALEVSATDKTMKLAPTITKRLNKYHNIDDLYMLGYYKYDWSYSSGKVISYDPATGVIAPTVNGYGMGTSTEFDIPHFFFYNIPDELDCANEYYIDKKTGYLYILPTAEDLHVAVSGDMITMNGCDYISFVGLEFCYSTGSIVTATDTDHITVDRCNVHNIRRNAVNITGDNITITSCEFYDTGARSVDMNSGDRTTLTGGNSVIENCLFDHFGSVDKTGNPAIYVQGCGIRIAHNEICNSPNIGIYYSEYIWASNDITVEYNYLHNVVTQTSDSGAIYAGRNIAGHGSVVRYNLICDIGCPEEGFNPFSIYLDDYMSGQEVYGNIIFNEEGNSIFMHGGRDNKVYSNILISPKGNGYGELRFNSEIYDTLVSDEANLTRPMADREIFMILELMPYKEGIWAERFPNVAKYVYDTDYMLPYIDDPYCPVNCSFNEVYDNCIITTAKAFENENLEDFSDNVRKYATRIEPSTRIQLDENPFFVDPTHGDYSLREDADFIDIPYEKIGRY